MCRSLRGTWTRACSSSWPTATIRTSSETPTSPGSSWSTCSAADSSRAPGPATCAPEGSAPGPCLEQGGREPAAGGAHPRVLVADDPEQVHQVRASEVPVLAGGPPYDVEEPVECALDVAGAQEEVRGAGLRGHVVRGGVGVGQGGRSRLLGT